MTFITISYNYRYYTRFMQLINFKNRFLASFYRWLLKPLFFSLDPEFVHDSMVSFGEVLGKFRLTKMITRGLFYYSHPSLKQTILKITFENPIGLAAGFDKDARLTRILPNVGFGFEEIGSITAKPYIGNPKPRLARLKKSRSLLVNYGLKSEGAKAIASKLKNCKFNFPVGTSIAKTNSRQTVPVSRGIKDYVEGFSFFNEIGDYFTINISCPNTFGGQPFHSPENLDKLLKEIDKVQTTKPVFIKFSPDLSKLQVDGILSVVKKHRVHGFIMGNLTKKRNNKKIIDDNVLSIGGLSGKVVQNLSDTLISYLYQQTKGEYIIIGCGGVFSAEDAYKKIRLGASLIQLITGMVYQGPQTISEINRGLVILLKKDGYKNISDAVGSAHKLFRKKSITPQLKPYRSSKPSPGYPKFSPI